MQLFLLTYLSTDSTINILWVCYKISHSTERDTWLSPCIDCYHYTESDWRKKTSILTWYNARSYHRPFRNLLTGQSIHKAPYLQSGRGDLPLRSPPQGWYDWYREENPSLQTPGQASRSLHLGSVFTQSWDPGQLRRFRPHPRSGGEVTFSDAKRCRSHTPSMPSASVRCVRHFFLREL
jgi:hypothetical protein